MFVIFSNRLGCLGSIVVSIVISVLLLSAMRACSGPVLRPEPAPPPPVQRAPQSDRGGGQLPRTSDPGPVERDTSPPPAPQRQSAPGGTGGDF